MNRLTIHFLGGKSTYLLFPEGIEIEDKTLLSLNRWFVRFDSVGYESRVITLSSQPLFWAAVIFTLLTCLVSINLIWGSDPDESATIFYGGFAAFFGGFYLRSKKIYEYFPSYSVPLFIRYRERDKDKIDRFKDNMERLKWEYLVRKTSIDVETLGLEDTNELLVEMRGGNIINDEQFLSLRNFAKYQLNTPETIFQGFNPGNEKLN